MFFILQKEGKYIENQEVFVMNDILKRHSYIHDYSMMGVEEMRDASFLNGIKDIKTAIPIGSIEFVQAYLTSVHGITHMNPIEVPTCLREDKYVKREYSIIDKKELPQTGYYFTKYVSELKCFYNRGMMESLHTAVHTTKSGTVPLLKKGWYQLSEVVDFLAEFRCFVQEDKIVGIQYYDGDVTVFPNDEEVNLIREMVSRYSFDTTRPQSYTLDIGIIKDRGLAIIECHPHVSVGLYGLSGNFLLHSYKQGLDWYIQHNTPITPYSNKGTYQLGEQRTR